MMKPDEPRIPPPTKPQQGLLPGWTWMLALVVPVVLVVALLLAAGRPARPETDGERRVRVVIEAMRSTPSPET